MEVSQQLSQENQVQTQSISQDPLMEALDPSTEQYEIPSQEQPDQFNALNLKWVLGFNKDIVNGVHNLSTRDKKEIFYTAAHTGIIYNYETREQRLLQGHCNQISCCTVSLDREFIVTADQGDESMLVVWSATHATPVKTIFYPHPKGVYRIALSADNVYIATLSNEIPQTLTIWDWSRNHQMEDNAEIIVRSFEVPQIEDASNPYHYSIEFNHSDSHEIATNGQKWVIFWKWGENNFVYYPELDPKDFFKKEILPLTYTVFIPNCQQAVTGTKDGYIVVWDVSLITEGDAFPDERRPIKMVQLISNPIMNFQPTVQPTKKQKKKGQKQKRNTTEKQETQYVSASILTVQGDYLVVGSNDAAVRFYDFQYRLQA